MILNDPVPINALDTQVLTRISIAVIVGLLLGLDREYRGHAAGLRTHGLICVAAAITTISILGLYGSLEGARMDPLRIYEATGSFVGIIGAGLIVFSKGQVHNITTAAHLWLTACIGIACGAAQWPLVTIGTIVSLVMLTLLRLVERKEGDRTLPDTDGARDGAEESRG